ncbi:MAG: formate C-acetyltransferase/glycerol dehydratase family glycyl radical enzyme [Atopobiaceae bacterium]|jgi:formate C-acetyltransferase|nr:formate C-acetyltransferase/glycerol dehydratase family glycyl radical enzyme [Atopobiaceae bacterium]MCH4181267.1 formate C-acetyltransferase/glycerol dehydratase family glycyl radical enzyme [Atopobiaceae bacterium]MCH4214797.1 formate C-acetyltransferase/glycerol dehydratase family glycyl radical enzyme [Atopobiaceae bacterium]MCH4276815.1 formate C-acetyltransferase/glycerol dehydratase family glycyl radical enzyme [Atopobiaceae bacterium]MCI1226160.1 formate C-acetyltransferase/glycerol
MLTKRTQAIRDSLFSERRQVSLERATLYMESYQQTEGEAPVIRRAKALRHLLENHRIVIDDHDLLVGNRSAKPRAGVVSPEMSPYWILDELDDFPTRPQDTFEMSEEDKAFYRDVLYPFWAGRSLNDWYRAHVAPDVLEAERTKVFAVAQTDKGQGHIICDFPMVLERGFGAILDDVAALATTYPDNDFYAASRICLEAVIAYVGRYEHEVRTLAATPGTSAARAGELTRMAEVLAHIARQPARDLYDALQLVWLVEVVLQHESNASSFSLGRADQYLWPYYQATMDELAQAGLAPDEAAARVRELIQCFYLKCNTIVAIRSTESARFFAGFPIGFNLVVGGLDEHGHDCTNELSSLLLDVQADTRLPQPNLSLRLHDNTPAPLLREACRIIRLGDGVPQVFNDEANVLAFTNRGVSLADARDYAVVGCVELSIPGRMYGLHDICMFNMMRCLEIALAEHPDGFATYDGLESSVMEVIDRYVALMVEGCNTCDEAHRETSPTPLLSTLVHDSVAKGTDITAGGARYNPSGVQGVGTANLADSLEVMRKVLFDERSMGYAGLMAMLARDWQGEGDEACRQRLIHRYPKYGNDVDEVDQIGERFLAHYGSEVARYQNPRGGRFQPGSYTVSAHIPLGAVVGATPDGRRAGEQLADGGLSPMVGRDTHGPTASLRSVSKLDNALDSNGSLLNVKFSPATLAGDGGLDKLMAYLRTFSRLKVQHIQFNVVDRATLLDAQAHPEDHQDLVVRVAGYSAMFVELSRAIQDDIINRTEHTL